MVPEVSRISVLSSGRCQGLKVSMPLRRPYAVGEGQPADVVRLAGKQRGVEIGPEPGDEEHHLGGDEQDHAVAVRNLHHAGMEALILGFAHHVAPPADEGVDRAEHAEPEHQRRGRVHMMHPADAAERHQKGGGGADRRPGARIHQVVVVMIGVTLGHRRLRSFSLRACSNFLSGASATGCSGSGSR